ncbi:hypothetical protein [Herpetosiphon gulosus]|uniref:hypothetical protein n=1 Tax=Herpetosiphon gulosus TaxID=1973496 RepID=UPI0031ECFAC8
MTFVNPIINSLHKDNSVELVRYALHDPAKFKLVDPALAQHAPDPAAANLLIAAFEAGTAPAWLVAYLLGRIGADCGYATVRAIVLAALGQLAESYAAVAMVRIRGAQAFADLAELLNTAPQRASREAAANGLAEFGSAEAAEYILAAGRAQTIRLNIAGGLLGRLPCNQAQIAELLTSDQAAHVRLALIVVKAMALNHVSDSRPEQALIAALEQTLANPAIAMAPQTRRNLTRWIIRA